MTTTLEQDNPTIVACEQLSALLEQGMTPDSYVLDVGCGMLRCGHWIIQLLKPGHYCGIEPVPERVKQGLQQTLDPVMIELKQPRFDHNDRFDFSVFGVKFTHFVARSIWSHTSKQQIELMLDGIAEWGAPNAVCLASFKPAALDGADDYQGDEWVGKSHESGTAGIVKHSVKWIREACRQRGLEMEISRRAPVKSNEQGQVWAVVRKTDDGAEELRAAHATLLAREIKHNIRSINAAVAELAAFAPGTLDDKAARKVMREANRTLKATRATLSGFRSASDTAAPEDSDTPRSAE